MFMQADPIVPILLSVGLISLLLKALVFPVVKLQPAYSHSSRFVSSNAPHQFDFAVSSIDQGGAMARIGNESRARQFVDDVRLALEKYRDVDVALTDGYLAPAVIPNGSIWEFTNYWHAFKAAFDFNTDQPASLIYERDSQGQFTLIGAAYSAPERFTQEQLDQRIPRGAAKWEQHRTFGWVARIFLDDNVGRVAAEKKVV